MERLARLEAWLWGRAGRLGLAVGDSPDVKRVAEGVAALSDVYTVDRAALASAGDASHLAAKVLYFLASDAPKVWCVLDELARRGALPSEQSSISPTPPSPQLSPGGGGGRSALRVIDLGCGVGATAAGVLLSLDAGVIPKVNLLGVDASAEVLGVWSQVAAEAASIAGVEVSAATQRADLREPDAALLARPFDLVVAQAMVNELFRSGRTADRQAAAAAIDEATAWVAHWATRGLTVLIEPALRETTRPLHAVRDRLLRRGGVRVLAPCPHQRDCPMLRVPHEWCHESRVLPPTPRVAEVQALTRRRDERCKFSFVALSPLGREAAGDPSVLGAEVEGASGDGLLTLRLLSEPLGSKGKTERYACAADGRLITLRLLDRDRDEANAAFLELPAGTLVRLPGSAVPRLGRGAVVERAI